MKVSRRGALTGLAGILAAHQAPAVFAQTRIVVGQSAPLTGSNAPFGNSIVAGARAWFNRYNRNGNLQIEHLVLDDANDNKRSGPNAQTLVERGAAVAFGFASATLSLPALPILKEARVPLFAPFTGATVIHGQQDPLVFTARASYVDEATKFVEILRGFGITRVGVVHFADRVGFENRDVVVAALEKLNMQAAPILATERNKPVTDATINQLLSARPPALIFTTTSAPTAEIIKRASVLGMPRSTFLVTLSFTGPSEVLKLLGNLASGLVVSYVVPRPWGNDPIAMEHAQAMKAVGPDTPTFSSLESYIAAKALTTAIDRVKSNRPAAIVGGLQSLNLDFGGYRLQYSRNNHHGSKYVDYMIMGVDFLR